MTRLRRLIGVLIVIYTAPAGAQEYRVRIDARAQAVSFRGLVSDSIAASLVVPSATGGLETPDGYAVRCGSAEYCFFMRPADAVRGIPAATAASVVVWGLGVDGLVFRATGRLLADLSGDQVWPATEPPVQFIEGYFEYPRSALVARVGRQLVASRLEPIGFDGGWLRVRSEKASVELTGYGGLGLGQAATVSVLNPALNPLDEWRPRDRQIVAGGEAAWLNPFLDVRAEYRREIDPLDDYFVSERTALSFSARAAAFRAAGGFDYNIAEGHLGSADLTLTYSNALFTVSGGVRRYQPYFSLWTLWGAFSPVPYNAVNAFGQVRATSWLSVYARTERYRYESADVSTGLVPQLEDRGWRATAGALATLNPHWSFGASYNLEHGPGASGRFADGTASYSVNDRYSFGIYGGTVARPLELRYYDATSRWIGARADWRVDARWRLWTDVAFIDDGRDRPDAGASSLEQFRLRAGSTLVFGSNADRSPLPPARRPAG